jgi:hypothetical protein
MSLDQLCVTEEDWIQDRDEAQVAFSPSQMTLRTLQQQTNSQKPIIQASSKKLMVRSTIEENEENHERNTPTSPSPRHRPTTKPVEVSSLIDSPKLPSNLSKMILETVIEMVKRSKAKLDTE